ncbi:MAG: DUF4058 family protein [Gemmataceae bacterium]
MPLRDHFSPKWKGPASWDMFHGGWPMMLVLDLKKILPPGYMAGPLVHLGKLAEVDIGAFEKDDFDPGAEGSREGGVAVAAWPTKPTTSFHAAEKDYDEYEVRIHNSRTGALVAAIEIVSPSNKDRPDHRRAFVSKCEALLRSGVCVSIIDLVTHRTRNLYRELLEELGHEVNRTLPPLYAATCRMLGLRVEAWEHPLTIGQRLPALPIWLAEDLPIRLDLEPSYESTCDVFDIPSL